MGYRIDRTCEVCGAPFKADRHDVQRGRGRFCTLRCYGRSSARARTTRPAGTKAERQRANGLINMRIRRGLLTRPNRCDQCGRGCRPDAHHDDYSKPAEVRWLCRSCHMKAHVVAAA